MDFRIKVFNYCRSNGFQHVKEVTIVTAIDLRM